MRFTLDVELGNDAMQTPLDVAEALQRLVGDISQRTMGNPGTEIVMGPHTVIAGNLRDGNGNRVGNWRVTA